jgi:hypothetical protein
MPEIAAEFAETGSLLFFTAQCFQFDLDFLITAVLIRRERLHCEDDGKQATFHRKRFSRLRLFSELEHPIIDEPVERRRELGGRLIQTFRHHTDVQPIGPGFIIQLLRYRRSDASHSPIRLR